MKLKKREITLNEADSLKDVFYMEKTLAEGYKREGACFRKETQNELTRLQGEAAEECALVRGLLKKSIREGL